jgi:hypothetical protein
MSAVSIFIPPGETMVTGVALLDLSKDVLVRFLDRFMDLKIDQLHAWLVPYEGARCIAHPNKLSILANGTQRQSVKGALPLQIERSECSFVFSQPLSCSFQISIRVR